MPENVSWIGPRLARTLLLLLAINAGAVIGDLFLGVEGSLLGAFVGFTVAIHKIR